MGLLLRLDECSSSQPTFATINRITLNDMAGWYTAQRPLILGKANRQG